MKTHHEILLEWHYFKSLLQRQWKSFTLKVSSEKIDWNAYKEYLGQLYGTRKKKIYTKTEENYIDKEIVSIK